MKRWKEKLFICKYLRIAIVCSVIGMLIGLFYAFFLSQVILVISPNLLSTLNEIVEIFIQILFIISFIFIIISMVRLVIYGRQVKHDKSYWEVNEDVQIMEKKDDPYLLPVKNKNPIPSFLIGIGCYIGVPYFICTNCLHFNLSQFPYIAVFLLMEYLLIMISVILIRLFRRFRAFRVK